VLRTQFVGALVITLWSAGCCFITLSAMRFLSKFRLFHPLRLRPTRHEEIMGFDQVEHNIHRPDASRNLDPVLVEANAPVRIKGRSKWTKVTAKRILNAAASARNSTDIAKAAQPPPEAGGPAQQQGGDASEEIADVEHGSHGDGIRSGGVTSKEVFDTAAAVFNGAKQERSAVAADADAQGGKEGIDSFLP